MSSLIDAAATYLLFVVAAVAVVVWLRAPSRDKVPFAVAGVAAAAVVGLLVKVAGAVWDDPRPFVVDHTTPSISHSIDNGFPSDHTALATAVAVVLWSRNRVAGAVCLALAVVLGAARVAAGVHHVPDIIGGLVFGALAGAAGIAIGRLVQARLDARPAGARDRAEVR